MNDQPKISICIPHWQVKKNITLSLRSISKHSKKYNLEVIVVDNGSRDESLDYLHSLKWIRLVERPEETHTNWPRNVFTAWDTGIRKATGDFFVSMHSDVFARSDDWLDPYLREMNYDSSVAGVGAWKLYLENPIYAFQKHASNYVLDRIKNLFGRKKDIEWKKGHYPRDYFAMYRREVIIKHNFTFVPGYGKGGGHSIAKQLWDAGYTTRMVPVREMVTKIFHIAHGTAAISKKALNTKREQKKTERRAAELYEEKWIKELEEDSSLDEFKGAS